MGDPTPEEIRKMTKEIQAEWSEAKRRTRAGLIEKQIDLRRHKAKVPEPKTMETEE